MIIITTPYEVIDEKRTPPKQKQRKPWWKRLKVKRSGKKK
jgi:hypothetical protein